MYIHAYMYIYINVCTHTEIQNAVNTYDLCIVTVCDGAMVENKWTDPAYNHTHPYITTKTYNTCQHLHSTPTTLHYNPSYLLAYTPQYKPHVHPTMILCNAIEFVACCNYHLPIKRRSMLPSRRPAILGDCQVNICM